MMKNGPRLWDAILADLNDPRAVIAGGCIRDFMLGVEPKDIDVFTSVDVIDPAPTSSDFFMEAFDHRRGLYRIESIHERTEEYAALSDIAVVSHGQMHGYGVDLIEMTDWQGGDALVAGFDFGITRLWFDQEGNTHFTPEFEKDFKNHTVTVYRDDRIERSMKRFGRFNSREIARGQQPWVLIQK